MQDTSNVPEQQSKRLLWVGIAAVIVLVAIIVGISFMMASMSRQDEQTAKTASPSASTVASKQEITENLSTLDASVKQATKDQTAAKEAIKASQNQTKIGN